jgi:hypothetical protein
MMTWTRTTIVVAALLACRTSEASHIGGFRLVGETANFAFYARDGRRPDAKRCQRFLNDTARDLGQIVEGKAPYYLYAHQDQIPVGSGRRNGMTELPSGNIHSVHEFHPHEIVHRVAGLLGDPGPFFSEGLAVWMAERGVIQGRSVDAIAREGLDVHAFRTIVDRFPEVEPVAAYATAGSFVGWLVRNHGGLPRLSDFLRKCEKAGFPRPSRFRVVYGFSLDEAAEQWRLSLAPVKAASR